MVDVVHALFVELALRQLDREVANWQLSRSALYAPG
jgi:hypothetical protein